MTAYTALTSITVIATYGDNAANAFLAAYTASAAPTVIATYATVAILAAFATYAASAVPTAFVRFIIYFIIRVVTCKPLTYPVDRFILTA